MVPVIITGTPMRFCVPRRLVYPTTFVLEKEACYMPGKKVRHPSLGMLFCERIILELDGEPDLVMCSVVRSVPLVPR